MSNLNVMTILSGLKQDQLEITRKIDKLEEQIKIQDNKKECWKPNYRDTYWRVDNGSIYIDNYRGSVADLDRLETGNYFKTKEEAKRYHFEIVFKFKLKKFAFENNEEDIDWSNTKQKWYIYYDLDSNIIETHFSFLGRECFQIHFTSREVAIKAIEKFKDDFIRYFTTNE